MKKNFVTLLAICICVISIFSLLTGCGGSSDKEPVSAEKSGTVAPYNDNKEQITLTLATPDNYYAPATYTNNLPVFQQIEKNTGIKIIWDVVPSSQYNTTMQTRFAAGNLPDIVNGQFADAGQYNSNGMIIPLEKYITEDNTPNAISRFKEYPLMEKLLRAADGHIYQISGIRGKDELKGNFYYYCIRKDWLDRLSLPVPQSLDEFYNVLKQFKEKDANGNGDPSDEIPFCEQHQKYNTNLAILGNSFGLNLVSSMGYSDAGDGVIRYDYISDNYKEYLRFLNKLYSEGLLDNEFTTITNDQINAKDARNIVGSRYAWCDQIIQFENSLASSGIHDGKYVHMPPLKGYDGKDSYIETFGVLDGRMWVTRDCKYPADAVRLLDYMVLSEDAAYLMNAGIEGKTFNNLPSGEIEYTDFVLKNPDGLAPYEALRSVGAWPTTPFAPLKQAGRAIFNDRPDIIQSIINMEPYIKDRIEFSVASGDEAEEETALKRDIETYRDEMELKFITGYESFDNWDKYINQMKELGVEKLIKIKQQQYDRLK